MSILETVTVFVGVPALLFAAIAGLVYVSSVRAGRRYRPGRPYEFAPVWFLAAPEKLPVNGRQSAAASLTSRGAPAVAASDTGDTEGDADTEAAASRSESTKGGARGTW